MFIFFIFKRRLCAKKNNIAVDYEYLFIVFFSSSDIIECMGNSDNVVRAGLTPKLKDVDTLLDILEFQPQSPEETKLVPTTTDDDPWVSIYNPPVDDFSVKKIQVSKTKPSFEINTKYTLFKGSKEIGLTSNYFDILIRKLVFLILNNQSESLKFLWRHDFVRDKLDVF